MGYRAFLLPTQILDTPRMFTAIAEWLAILVYFYIYRRRVEGKLYLILVFLSAILLIQFQFVAGLLPIVFWIPMMIGAVCLMYLFLYLVLDVKMKDCGVITVQAFVLAEFAASVYHQLFVWFCTLTGMDSFWCSAGIAGIVYALVYILYYRVEKSIIHKDMPLNTSTRELISVLLTGFGAFGMGNISFVWTGTPFSAQGNLPYVRTLVDFGGMLMLMTQMERKNEFAVKMENDEINKLFKKQYQQYRLAIENTELLRKEMHDMKHYLAALKAEEDPVKRKEVLADMERALLIQESFMNTGNQVLDVILTTKSQQCQKRGILLQAMVEGNVLSNIHVKDLCSLFGNILDNAIEATQMVNDPDKRLIILSVRRHNNFVVIKCENYSENKIEIEKATRLPGTTKKDKSHHGYGLKSIQRVAEKYGGDMTVAVQNGWFRVKVLLGICME